MFGWLKRLFGRKKNPEGNAEIGHSAEEAKEVPKEPVPVERPSEQRLAPHSSHEPDRPEKTCPHCGSPNDKFVHICWMCKAEI